MPRLVKNHQHLYATKTKHSTFFHKVCKCGKCHPMLFCIDIAKKKNAELVISQETEPGRRFGFYQGYDEYIAQNKYKNYNNYEIITGECKLYFDIEYTDANVPDGETPEGLFERTKKAIKRHYETYFGMPLDDTDMFVTNASGLGEKGQWLNILKYSYHIVVNNGFFFQNTRECLQFITYIKDNEECVNIRGIIDKAPYNGNQSFKLPYQGKLGSLRVHVPQNGTFRDFFVSRYTWDRFVGFYSTTHTAPTNPSTRERDPNKAVQKKDKYTGIVDDLDVGVVSNATTIAIPLDRVITVENLLNVFGNEGYEWETWFCVLCVCKNETELVDTFLRWSRMSPKHNEQDAINAWNSLEKRSTKCYNISTLMSLVNRKYPMTVKLNTKKMTSVLVNEVSVPTINFNEHGYDTIIYNEKYCKSLYELAQQYGDIHLDSHLGTGKSTAICDLVKRSSYKSIVCITPRKAFARSIYTDLKAVEPEMEFYQDIPKNERAACKFVVCQLESLTTLNDNFDLVIFDESESNLAQFDSSTIKNFHQTTTHFKSIMTNAKTTVWSDAFLMDRSLVICSKLRHNTQKVYVKNTFQPYKRDAYKVGHSASQFLTYIDRFTQQNKKDRNIIATGSKQNCNDIFEKINKPFMGIDTTLKITSDTADSVIKKMADVNTLWGRYKNVVYTTSVTVGVSYDRTDLPFNNLFLHFSAWSSTVRDMFQSSLRARTITSNNMYYSHYSKYNGMDRFPLFDREKLRKVITERDAIENTHLDDWVIDMWVFNNQEKNMNAYNHEDVLKQYLEICGYTMHVDIEEDDEEKDKDKEAIENDYSTIADISYEKYQEHDLLIKKGGASVQVKKEHKKYEFNHLVLNDCSQVPPEVKLKMYGVYNQHKEHVLKSINNIKLEKHYIEVQKKMGTDIDATMFDCGVSVYIDNKLEKLERLSVIKDILGIGTTYEVGSSFDRAGMKKLRQYIQENISILTTEWGLDMHNIREKLSKAEKSKALQGWTDALSVGVFKQILNKWGFSTVITGERTRTRVNGIRVENTPYYIQSIGDFSDFEKHCLFHEYPVEV